MPRCRRSGTEKKKRKVPTKVALAGEGKLSLEAGTLRRLYDEDCVSARGGAIK